MNVDYLKKFDELCIDEDSKSCEDRKKCEVGWKIIGSVADRGRIVLICVDFNCCVDKIW